jgi:hypothetical protein
MGAGLLADDGLGTLGILRPEPSRRHMEVDEALVPLNNVCHLLAKPATEGNQSTDGARLNELFHTHSGPPPKPPFTVKTRVRNRVSPSGTVGENGIFTKEVLCFRSEDGRSCGIAGLVAAEGFPLIRLNDLPHGQLGADRGRVRIHITEGEPHSLEFVEILKQLVLAAIQSDWPGYLALYVATPLVLCGKSWHPDLSAHGLTLEGAADTQKEPISGWEVGRGPKPMLSTVPPGCVYYYSIGDKEKAMRLVRDRHFTSFSDAYGRLGHGICLFGLRKKRVSAQ